MIVWLATPLLATVLVLVGRQLRGVLAAPSDSTPFRLHLWGTAGLLLLYAGMLLSDAAGLPWRRRWLIAILLVVGILCRLGSGVSSPPRGERLGDRWGWGDGVAMVAIVALTVASWRLWIVNPDFVYHWGVKGAKFQLARGIDWPFLEAPWHQLAHPGYPQLLPALFAATGIVAGKFHQPSMMLWTPLVLLAMVVAARQALVVGGATRFARQATVAAVALSSAMFGIGHRTAGGPDWLIALAFLAAVPALVDPAAPGRVAQVALAAALAVGSKVEGIPLALLLLFAFVIARPADRLRSLVGSAVPALLVGCLWWVPATLHGLEEGSVGAIPQLGLVDVVGRAALAAADVTAWHGAGLLLFALPPLLLARHSRRIAAVAALQLAGYFFAYLAAPPASDEAVRFWVLSSFPRLISHLLPAILVALGLALGGRAARLGREEPASAAIAAGAP